MSYKRQKKIHRDPYREADHVKMEAEIRVMLPQAKECQEPAKAGRGKEDSPLELSEGA